MTKQEIITKVKDLHLPTNSYVVFGSAPLAVAGIREANDIDLLVSVEVFEGLKNQGWRELDKGGKDKPLVHDIFEAHVHWNFSSYRPTLDRLFENATIVDGVPVASLEEVRRWKVASGRQKDLLDIQLIDQYWEAK